VKYEVTIFSPADGEEHVFETEAPITVSETLSNQLEVGAWFKIERKG
jgi:hypothetical protein